MFVIPKDYEKEEIKLDFDFAGVEEKQKSKQEKHNEKHGSQGNVQLE